MAESVSVREGARGLSVRQPQHHGFFYPADPGLLNKQLDDYLSTAGTDNQGHQLKALVVPHAGYDYSGRVAALAYSALRNQTGIRRIAIFAPNHQSAVSGGLVCSHDYWSTPLGRVIIDQAFSERHWLSLSGVTMDDSAHQVEYSIEVQLPFIQKVLPDAAVAPILLGDCSAEEIAAILSPAWECTNTLLIISSDLYHYLPREEALPAGMAIARAIEQNNSAEIGPERACGHVALTGLMRLTQQEKSCYWRTLAVQHSAASNRFSAASLVGYGAFLLLTSPVSRLSD